MGEASFLSKFVSHSLREARRRILHRSTLDPALPHVQSVPESISTRKRRPRCETDHSSSFGAEIRNDKIYTSFNLSNPTGHVMHQHFNIQQLYALPTLYLCVLYLSENKQ